VCEIVVSCGSSVCVCGGGGGSSSSSIHTSVHRGTSQLQDVLQHHTMLVRRVIFTIC